MRRTAATLMILGLVVAACGEDDDEPASTEGVAATDPAPTTAPPTTAPPTTEPVATDPPATEPPAGALEPDDPPATEPPATDPPATEPPATDQPAGDQPAIDAVHLDFIMLDAVDDLTALSPGEPPPGPIDPAADIVSCEGDGNVIRIKLAGDINPLLEEVDIFGAQIGFGPTPGNLAWTAIGQFDTAGGIFEFRTDGDPRLEISNSTFSTTDEGSRFEFELEFPEEFKRDIEKTVGWILCAARYSTDGVENLNEDTVEILCVASGHAERDNSCFAARD